MVAGVGKLPEYVKFFSGFLLVGNHGVTALREQIMKKLEQMYCYVSRLTGVVDGITTHISQIPYCICD